MARPVSLLSLTLAEIVIETLSGNFYNDVPSTIYIPAIQIPIFSLSFERCYIGW